MTQPRKTPPRFAVVTTTIHVPTSLGEWAKGLDERDIIIVTGDVNTPHDAVRRFLKTLTVPTLYLEPSEQVGWTVSEHIGWRSIQRRNIATLEAIRLRPKFITTIDDDNTPIDPENYFHDVENILSGDSDSVHDAWIYGDSSGFVNMCHPAYGAAVVHRGLPRALHRHFMYDPPVAAKDVTRLGVFQSFWFGHPDIDALDRVHNDITVTPRGSWLSVAGHESWCPIDSQATTYRFEVAPLLCVWPHVGRADDIWGGYLARRVMDLLGWDVAYGAPFVRQDRGMFVEDGQRTHKTHMRELALEMFMYEHTETLCRYMRTAVQTGPAHHAAVNLQQTALSVLNQRVGIAPELIQLVGVMSAVLGHTAAYATFLPEATKKFLNHWTEDVITALYMNIPVELEDVDGH